MDFWVQAVTNGLMIIVFSVAICILNSKMNQLQISSVNSSAEYWRINTEFGLFLLAMITSTSCLPILFYDYH